MSLQDHVIALRAKHADLEQQIEKESLRPHPDENALHNLKREKLRIKDEIAQHDLH
ncbi:MAG: YdcH family protein [Tistlia sp.]|uniref:YdcH family protein n=1 Tax=Tistlia sp. TaxID=3057121 RepID=UPI0034A4E3DF